ncbi:hypothetical protein BB561_002171 [Smittium simulii]|uniref:Cytosolic iron-sulfur protein assembly protein 1 n=1 Tax=Smittium simulii TaxID=133385 RepID=A0A2T9YRH5_9FUNG|nr:hypothetical protein BB561_002171 [Smittium simulii]
MNNLIQVAVLKGHEKQAWDAKWKKNSSCILSCSGDKSLRMWAPIKQNIPNKLSEEDIKITNQKNLSESVDEQDQMQEETIDNFSWVCLFNLEQSHQRAIRSVSFEPTSSEVFASASFDGSTGIWSKNSSGDYECFTSLEGHENEVKCVSWSPSGQLVATCGRDKSIWIWESMGEYEFECISVLMEHTQDVKALRWHPFEEILVSASYDDTIRIWKENEDDWYCSSILSGHNSTVWSVDFDPTGNYIGEILLYNKINNKYLDFIYIILKLIS